MHFQLIWLISSRILFYWKYTSKLRGGIFPEPLPNDQWKMYIYRCIFRLIQTISTNNRKSFSFSFFIEKWIKLIAINYNPIIINSGYEFATGLKWMNTNLLFVYRVETLEQAQVPHYLLLHNITAQNPARSPSPFKQQQLIRQTVKKKHRSIHYHQY